MAQKEEIKGGREDVRADRRSEPSLAAGLVD